MAELEYPIQGSLGRQILVDLYECNADLIKDVGKTKTILLEAVRRSNATIITEVFHTFSPYGVSGVVIIAESHVAIHSWPEFRFASIDIFSCSAKMNAEVIYEYAKAEFHAKKSRVTEVGRGAAINQITHQSTL